MSDSTVPNLGPVGEDAVREATKKAATSASRRARTSVAIGPEQAGSAYNQVSGLFQQYEPLGNMLPWDVLDYIEILAVYNPDYSQAVDNIRTLANSGHELFVTDSSKNRAKRVKSFLELQARSVQARHGGIDGLIDKLLYQGAVFGAMCGEWVLDDDLTSVVDFVEINPKHIRFFWSKKEQRWLPFQKVSPQQAEEARANGQEVVNNCVRLNELTFHYYAFNAAPNSPYGTPPFVAALTNIAIQRDMVHNMSQIVKKLGLLGIIDLVVEQLPPRVGETDEQYEARASAYLSAYGEAVEEMVRDGGIVHFDDVELKTTQLGGNAAGATNIFKQNEELIFSGLKSMPSVQGRSYSTTETYAGVAYDIIIRNTLKYQRAVKRIIEAGYWLMVAMEGDMPDGIKIKFNDNKTLQRLHNAQSEQMEIRNMLLKWALGIIDQAQGAQELGYSSVAREYTDPPTTTQQPNTSITDETSDGKTETASVGSFVLQELQAALKEAVPQTASNPRQDEESSDE